MLRILPLTLILVLLGVQPAEAEPETPATAHLSQFGAGAGPTRDGNTLRLLDGARTPGQSNAIAFDREHTGAHAQISLRGRLRVLEGGDGGAFLFLHTDEYGPRGPAPFVKQWTEPNLRRTFAVGIDVHNPPNKEPFSPWGNYQGLPQREVSLHFDGREIVKRVAPTEFRGDFADVAIEIAYVVGGAEVTVNIAGTPVYDRYFVAHMHPYEMRLAVGAGTRTDSTTQFDVADLSLEVGAPSGVRRPPLHVEVFHHVLTDSSTTAYEAEVELPPSAWAFGRVIMTIDIHDAGTSWDEWDRNGEVSIWDDEGVKLGIVPFITSYRTPCHWKVDVTHFRPFLAGKRKFEIAAGTTFHKNRGFLMSMSLDFHHGTPALEPFRVVPLWVGTARYRSDENHFKDFYADRDVEIPAGTTAARIATTTTGHSQIGEFTPSKRTLVVTPKQGDEARRFPHVVWKTDCYLNPNRPQFGTWKFSRAGWAPGDVVRPWWVDLGASLTPGTTASFRCEPEPYAFPSGRRPADDQVFAARHVVRSYLVLYRPPAGLVAAPTLRIGSVTEGSNAAKAGMKRGDYLAEYDGKRVDRIEDLRAALAAAKDAKRDKVVVVVFRGTRRVELTLDAGRMGISLGR